ncbi:BrnT family toxin [Azospirillum formosense]|uniref:BrnT family toxin n=1 Tax=Azospirillum formosense TaxID=861533 RepID=UPI00157AB335|nr:BrnT family toxin [Azospirillum formosense]MBY3754601.1 BrnT family toxin [Azospirillum formosense]
MSPRKITGIPYLPPGLQYGNPAPRGIDRGAGTSCWDDAKNETNIEKHGIGFVAATLLLEGLTVEVPDTRHAYGGTRINAFGTINGRLFVARYTPRCNWRRWIGRASTR